MFSHPSSFQGRPSMSAPPQLARQPVNLFQEFRAFLDKYGVIGLAIALVIGTAVTKLVSAVVADVLMPIVGALMPTGDWRQATWGIGSKPNPDFGKIEGAGETIPRIAIKYGDLFGAIMDFLIIAAFVFLMVKYLLREKDVTKK